MTPDAAEKARCLPDSDEHLGHLGHLAPPDLIAAARGLGVQVALDGAGGLRLRAPAPPPPVLLAALRSRKTEIVSILRAAAVIHWRNANPPPPTPEGVCIHCGRPGADLASLVGDKSHRWVHGRCWHDWQAARLAQADCYLLKPQFRGAEGEGATLRPDG